MKTFKAADGRRVTARMTEDEIAERSLVNLLTAVTPVIVILVFALAAGLH